MSPYYATHRAWTTRDELDFLAGLGRWRGPGRAFGPARRALLVGYREGLEHRRVWAGVDRALVVLATENEIRKEERYGAPSV